MYKFLIPLAALMVVCNAATVVITPKMAEIDQHTIDILKSVADRHADGSYMFAFEGADGSARQESAKLTQELLDDGEEGQVLEIAGSYRYIDADGQPIEVQYTAGKNGFIVQGTNIPAEITMAAKEGAAIAEYARRHPDVKLKSSAPAKRS